MAVSAAVRQLVRHRAQGLCEYCHADERWQFVRFTMDHLIPQSTGGSDDSENLALACRNCNERRSNRSEAFDWQTGDVVAIFDPRRESWDEHFVWAANKVEIVGLTPTGRGTLHLLDMNDDRHEGIALRIRQRDSEDGFHPPAGDPVLSE
ncbi:MAG: HNH endonuclease signature motif containing protein [Planctomycetaceae bacterium]|nr:HNH endonuclease signature motif containing protein [Planctomycetaceae bacterium]